MPGGFPAGHVGVQPPQVGQLHRLPRVLALPAGHGTQPWAIRPARSRPGHAAEGSGGTLTRWQDSSRPRPRGEQAPELPGPPPTQGGPPTCRHVRRTCTRGCPVCPWTGSRSRLSGGLQALQWGALPRPPLSGLGCRWTEGQAPLRREALEGYLLGAQPETRARGRPRGSEAAEPDP